jgi:hypothetical protein
VAGCGECGDEPSGSCATELVNAVTEFWVLWDTHEYVCVYYFVFCRQADSNAANL